MSIKQECTVRIASTSNIADSLLTKDQLDSQKKKRCLSLLVENSFEQYIGQNPPCILAGQKKTPSNLHGMKFVFGMKMTRLLTVV